MIRNCLTVDVEEWFHVCGAGGALAHQHWDGLPARVVANTHDLLELLDRCGVRATFFVLGWVALRYPGLVAEIAKAGHEIGSHGHLHNRVYELTPADFAHDLDQSLAALRAAGVPTVNGFRAPEWSIDDRSLWALEILARKGFRFDSSMTPLPIIGNPRYAQRPHVRSTAAGELLEFSPLVDRRFGQNMPLGGGWGLRMSDPGRVVAAIDARNALGIPVALFVHPWELDPHPPRIEMPWVRRFTHYASLRGFRDRLTRVLGGANSVSMGEVLEVTT